MCKLHGVGSGRGGGLIILKGVAPLIILKGAWLTQYFPIYYI